MRQEARSIFAHMKKAGSRAGFLFQARAYFLSSDFDSLGEAGVVPIGDVVLLELELEPPMPDVLPAEPGVVDVSAPGAGVGEGAVVVEGAVDAGGGVTTFSSFLLQAVRPIATRATIRSERFMFFSFSENITRLNPKERTAAMAAVRERPTRSS
jgi:hypothetical protein